MAKNASAASLPTPPGVALGIPEDQTFTVAELVEGAATWLGHPSHAVRGALHDVSDRLTLTEAAQRVGAFLDRPIENDPGRGV